MYTTAQDAQQCLPGMFHSLPNMSHTSVKKGLSEYNPDLGTSPLPTNPSTPSLCDTDYITL